MNICSNYANILKFFCTTKPVGVILSRQTGPTGCRARPDSYWVSTLVLSLRLNRQEREDNTSPLMARLRMSGAIPRVFRTMYRANVALFYLQELSFVGSNYFLNLYHLLRR